MNVLTPRQMHDADTSLCKSVGDVAPMRAAGTRIAEVIRRYACGPSIVAFAGRGNNGGDAYAALAELPDSYTRVVYAERTADISNGRRDAEERARAAGVQTRPFPQALESALDALRGCDLAIDALVGTGARFPLPADYAHAIAALNESGARVLAVDVPSGVDAERGAVVEPAVKANVTVTLGALKLGLLLTPGRAQLGDLWLADIGAGEQAQALHPSFHALDDREFFDLLPRRGTSSDKRSAGAPLIIAGSTQFPGAAVLCALGAARAGAGYVTVAASAQAAQSLRLHLIEQVVIQIDDALTPHAVIDNLLDAAKHCSSIGIGPGLSLDSRTGEIVRGFVERCDLPLVADASALFHFSKHLEIVRGKAAVLTPHEGEFSRLSGKGSIREGDRIARLREFVDRTGVTTLLKGEATLIDDGQNVHINTTGTAALATAGTGDVLTGIIATLLSQGLTPVDAARTGAYWHGLAGKSAASLRPVGVIARDIPEALAPALCTIDTREMELRRIF